MYVSQTHLSQQGLLVSYVVQYFDWPGLGMEFLVHQHVKLKDPLRRKEKGLVNNLYSLVSRVCGSGNETNIGPISRTLWLS